MENVLLLVSIVTGIVLVTQIVANAQITNTILSLVTNTILSRFDELEERVNQIEVMSEIFIQNNEENDEGNNNVH